MRANPAVVGERFGMLTAVRMAEPNERTENASQALVVCDCGTQTKPVRLGHLRSGRVTSCGCQRAGEAVSRRVANDLTGQQFGRLTAIRRTGNVADGQSAWECRCICGTTTTVRAGHLRSGKTTSCSCARDDWNTNPRRKAVVTYVGAHRRVRHERGPARANPCVDCGAAAEHWSYNHQDPDEVDGVVHGWRLAYSLEPQFYEPRCIPCHNRFDHPTEVSA